MEWYGLKITKLTLYEHFPKKDNKYFKKIQFHFKDKILTLGKGAFEM